MEFVVVRLRWYSGGLRNGYVGNCKKIVLSRVMGANHMVLGRVHPYEEPAYEVYRMEDV